MWFHRINVVYPTWTKNINNCYSTYRQRTNSINNCSSFHRWNCLFTRSQDVARIQHRRHLLLRWNSIPLIVLLPLLLPFYFSRLCSSSSVPTPFLFNSSMACCGFDKDAPEEPGQVRVRGCTDSVWLCVFLVLWCLMVSVCGFHSNITEFCIQCTVYTLYT